MFIQKKKRKSKKIYVILIVSLLVIVALIMGIKLQKNHKEQIKNDVLISKKVSNESAKEKTEKVQAKEETYYLVKLNNDSICVFFSDEKGDLIELEKTTIVFETLNTEDQNKFIEGIKLDTREALNDLIMNYES